MSDRPTAKVIPFKAPRSDYALMCPDCGGISWQVIMVDLPQLAAATTIQCDKEGCGFWTMGVLVLGDDDDGGGVG